MTWKHICGGINIWLFDWLDPHPEFGLDIEADDTPHTKSTWESLLLTHGIPEEIRLCEQVGGGPGQRGGFIVAGLCN